MHVRSHLIPVGFVATALVLTGCAASPGDAEAVGGRLQVVTSTDVYGDIAGQIAGGAADVVSIISGATQDPHSYEATTQDQLTLSKADLVVANGGGYDPFIDTMLDASGAPDVVVVTAVDESGLLEDEEHADEEHGDHGHIEGFNEHVWYSLHAVEHIAEAIARELGALDDGNAETYAQNLAVFAGRIADLEEVAHGIHETAEGKAAMVTEPVAEHLLDELGLDNVTPAEFVEAVEEGSDISPVALQETLDRLGDGSVALLAHNEQTTDPVTQRVRDAASAAGVPVVSLTETLPDGVGYLEWMESNLAELQAALGG
ncbi:metal ABC transporter solute-binding protein, Zn/Mn family [Lysobacter korlensis]|uniref:Metal ABC transporter solute-binding protein, Zn/Mn family n=1 Tax=Lysobacter korlensis TaxID=553636 RepID=A0ABV6RWX0_9GAMM